jgi:O-antigen/teichoic acid export membrane protein
MNEPQNVLPPEGTPEVMSRTTKLQALMRDTIKTRFFKQGLRMTIARFISLGVGLFGSIWAARCLGPTNLGISGMIIGTVNQLVLLGALNQNANLVRGYKNAASPAEAADLVSTAFTFRTIYTLVIMAVATVVMLVVHVPSAWIVGIVAAFPFFLFGVNVPDWVLQGEGNMPACYMVGTLQALVIAGLYFVFFRPGMGPGSDVIVWAIGTGVYFSVGWYIAVGKRKIKLFRPSLAPKMFPILAEGRWLILMGVINYILVSLESPLLGYLYSIKEVGTYRAATQIALGAQAFLLMVSDLMYPRLIEWRKEGIEVLWQRQKKVAVVLAAILLPLGLLAFLITPIFFHFFYGPAFQRAAYPCALLLFSRMVAVLTRIYGYGLVAQKEDRKLAIVCSSIAILSLGSNCFFIPRYGIYASSLTNLASEILSFSLELGVSYWVLSKARIVAARG